MKKPSTELLDIFSSTYVVVQWRCGAGVDMNGPNDVNFWQLIHERFYRNSDKWLNESKKTRPPSDWLFYLRWRRLCRALRDKIIKVLPNLLFSNLFDLFLHGAHHIIMKYALLLEIIYSWPVFKPFIS